MAQAKNRNHAMENIPPQVQEAIDSARAAPTDGVPPAVVDPASAKNQAKKQRLEDLISGRAEPPNEFAAYLITQVRDTLGKGNALSQRISLARRQLEQMEHEALRLEGAAEQCAADLSRWDKPLATGAPRGEDSSNKEGNSHEDTADQSEN